MKPKFFWSIIIFCSLFVSLSIYIFIKNNHELEEMKKVFEADILQATEHSELKSNDKPVVTELNLHSNEQSDTSDITIQNQHDLTVSDIDISDIELPIIHTPVPIKPDFDIPNSVDAEKLKHEYKVWREKHTKAYNNIMSLSKDLHKTDDKGTDFVSYMNSLTEYQRNVYMSEMKLKMEAYKLAYSEFQRIQSENPILKFKGGKK
ncbi:MAG: hypothetical protein OXI43_13470 [Candidatus Poribacteria bacterium]|nr:hypothetical protein [Candidatus Poribacteria bacterium]